MRILSLLAVAAAMTAGVALADHHEEKKAKAMCPVMDRPINKEFSADYKGGTVYFCCAKCVDKFKADSEKYAMKANHQLVATGQAEQKACPLTGGKLNPEKTVMVSGVEVEFCCGNCQGKVTKADDKQKMEMVFSDKAFEKAFEVKSDS